MNEALQEFVDSRGVELRVDRASGVLRGVKLIGLESLNGRRYRPAALAAAVGLYEGAKVNVDHPKNGPLAPRDYRDRLGVIRQVEFRPDEGLFGNLHYNPKHPLAEQLAWDAEHNPRNVGFSHNVLARLSREEGRSIVESIAHVQSVDLVADPAATRGLFEQQAAGRDGSAGDVAAPGEAARLREQLDDALRREAGLRRQLTIREALQTHRLAPAGARSLVETLGRAFYEALLTAGDEQQVEALIAERAEALRGARAAGSSDDGQPRSRPWPAAAGRLGDGVEGAAEFARALRLPQ
ncbi:MAG: hypothetical protein DCC67_06560 [Planctomycetota bacterium]|nr:MAG: hypothetical protein DCC67_06560 [Planctomycetota bacterium]